MTEFHEPGHQFKPPGHVYEFGSFKLIPVERQLLRDGKPIPLKPKVFDTLVVLVQNTGHILKKDDLIKTLWPDSFVEESNLNHNISVLRKALNESNGDGYIETIRGFGFRFNGVVRAIDENTAVLHRSTRTHVVIKEQETEEQTRTAIDRGDSRRTLRSTRLIFGLGLAAVLVTGWAVFWRGSSERNRVPARPAIHSIAVLPFKSLTDGNEDAHLGLGMADALITKLGQIKGLGIRSTSAIQQYAEGNADPVTVGRELEVEAVLDGRIQRSGERVRITVQLLSVRAGTPLWTEEFDGKFTEIFEIQDSVFRHLVRSMGTNLSPLETARLAKRGTENTRAYEAYLIGRYLWSRRTTESVRQSIDYFQQAIAADPNFALAYDGLADAYLIYDTPKAESTLRKSLELDETLGEAHASLGFLRMFWHWDWPGAEAEFKRAIELKGNYATAHQWYGLYLAARARFDEAKKEMTAAIELDPRSPNMHADMAQIHYFANEYDEAIAQCRKALEIDADFAFAHNYLVAAYAKKGMYAEAVETQLKSVQGRPPQTTNLMREAFMKSGWKGFLQSELDSEQGGVVHSRRAWLYAMMGDRANALKELQSAYDARDFFLTFLKVDPAFENLRTDPRFQEILQGMNLQ